MPSSTAQDSLVAGLSTLLVGLLGFHTHTHTETWRATANEHSVVGLFGFKASEGIVVPPAFLSLAGSQCTLMSSCPCFRSSFSIRQGLGSSP